MQDTLTIQEASIFITNYLQRSISPSNISYLIQYGRIRKNAENGNTLIFKQDLLDYYHTAYHKQLQRREKLGDDLNWRLSFDQYKESETTKHVHRLHPYKGKFIPQLVEYFLNTTTDDFKTETFFQPGDIILDPFGGSGTTMVQCSELGMHSIGIDISAFNCLISNGKVGKYDLVELENILKKITENFEAFCEKNEHIKSFDIELQQELTAFNTLYFPAPEYRYKVKRGEIDEAGYAKEKEVEFKKRYEDLRTRYHITLQQEKTDSFLGKRYINTIRQEIDFLVYEVERIQDENIKNIVRIILSRTVRSCRATTHSDLATLKDPVLTTYYCSKHGKICKPLFSMFSRWVRYSKDTIKRVKEFDSLRTASHQICLQGDSRTLDIKKELKRLKHPLEHILEQQKIKGIFSSPPYVGLIDYHEQHAYAYELFNLERCDESEIGPLFRGQGNQAKEAYVEGISGVLNNCKQFLADGYNVFLVANDKYGLYPEIAKKSGMQIVNQYKRPVLNRTEKDKGAYSEIIFHLKSL